MVSIKKNKPKSTSWFNSYWKPFIYVLVYDLNIVILLCNILGILLIYNYLITPERDWVNIQYIDLRKVLLEKN